MNDFCQNIINSLSFTQSPLVNALSIFLVGFLLSIWVKSIFLSFLKKIQFNNALERIGFNEFIHNFDQKIQVEKFIGFLVQFFIILVSLMFSLEAIQSNAFLNLLNKVVLYYPNILISIIIFIIAIYAIDFSQKIVIGTKTSKKITYSRSFAKIIDLSIRVLTVLAILYQLQIIPQLIIIVFIGVVLTISLSVGTSFGLAAKKPMAQLIKKLGSIFKF